MWKILLTITVAITVLGVSGWLITKNIVAKKIECFTQFGVCPEEFSIVLDKWQGLALYKPLPRNQIVADLKNFSQVRQVNIYRRLPNVLVVNIQLRQIIGSLNSGVLGAKVAVDGQGVVFTESNLAAVPELEIDGKVESGQAVSERQLQALEIMARLAQLTRESIKAQIVGDYELICRLSGGWEVKFDLNHVSAQWDRSLQAVLARSKMAGRQPVRVDLRFNNPVITY